jgi:superfamily II DNA helicase RecQ
MEIEGTRFGSHIGIGNHVDLLVIMPTKHGKSTVFTILEMVTNYTIIMSCPLSSWLADMKLTLSELV